MRFLGVDPGVTGAVCIYCPEDAPGSRWHLIDMPIRGQGAATRLDALELRDFIRRFNPGRAVIELVNPIAMGGITQGVVSTARFIGIARAIEAVVETCDLAPVLVLPAVWKSALIIPRVDKTPDQTQSVRSRLIKEASRIYAWRRFPELRPHITRKKDSDRAEAALMAYYGWSSLSPQLTDDNERAGGHRERTPTKGATRGAAGNA